MRIVEQFEVIMSSSGEFGCVDFSVEPTGLYREGSLISST